MKLSKEVVTVELKNGTTLHGTLLSVDVHMNMHLKNVKQTVPGQDALHLDGVTVRGSSVRAVLLGEEVPVETLLVDDRPSGGKGRKSGVWVEMGGWGRRGAPPGPGKMAIHRRK
jgi:small nuclear ribonucleoprotein D1